MGQCGAIFEHYIYIYIFEQYIYISIYIYNIYIYIYIYIYMNSVGALSQEFPLGHHTDPTLAPHWPHTLQRYPLWATTLGHHTDPTLQRYSPTKVASHTQTHTYHHHTHTHTHTHTTTTTTTTPPTTHTPTPPLCEVASGTGCVAKGCTQHRKYNKVGTQ